MLDESDEPYMTEVDIRKMFKISQSTTWRWVKKGLLPQPFYIGAKKYWYRRNVIDNVEKVKT